MKFLSRILIASMPLLALGASAQTTQRFTASKANEYGLVYSLPTTELDIYVETEHTRLTPGEFYNYTRRFLAIDNAITEPSTKVELKSITIVPRGVANDENRWMVQFKSGSTPYVLLNSDGIPLTVNTDEPADIDEPAVPEAVAAKPTILETEMARQAMTQDMIRSSSMSKRAELAAARILELRDTRSDLLSGEADNPPADGQAMKLVLDNLAGQEEALTAMFVGTKQTWTNVGCVTLAPDDQGFENQTIARISPFDGLIDADNLAGAPLTATVQILERGQLPVTENGVEKKFPKGGFAYQIPGTALITIYFEGREIASKQLPLAQLGVTFGLDPSLFTDKKAPSKLQLDPTTGGVLLLGPAN